MSELEEGTKLHLDWSKLEAISEKRLGVLPVAVQNADTREVILLAYVNEAALKASLETRTATFWSTSRNELWIKGATSGHTFDLVEVYVNCEQNSLLFLVRPRGGGICHTKNREGQPRNCFYRRLNPETGLLENTDP
ncbi:MAG: phosphoribosyl-AMP cyclohydrolase [Armatimonadetes bacterium]|nr:phosphoribosyl-AMP cyclohydrolase [Armatimonadota bacterium]